MNHQCKQIYMVEGVVNTLCADINVMKGKAPIGPGDISLQEKAMRASMNTPCLIDVLMRSMVISETDIDEKDANVQRAIEEPLKASHSQKGSSESNMPFEQHEDDDEEKKMMRIDSGSALPLYSYYARIGDNVEF